jgi:hypothetical protein
MTRPSRTFYSPNKSFRQSGQKEDKECNQQRASDRRDVEPETVALTLTFVLPPSEATPQNKFINRIATLFGTSRFKDFSTFRTVYISDGIPNPHLLQARYPKGSRSKLSILSMLSLLRTLPPGIPFCTQLPLLFPHFSNSTSPTDSDF